MSTPELLLERTTGPERTLAATPGMGLTGPRCWRWVSDGTEAEIEFASEWVGHVVGERERFSYAVHPTFDEAHYLAAADYEGPQDSPRAQALREQAYAATAVALDIEFTDGTRLEGATDQYGVALTPAGQAAAKVLHADQWNRVIVDLAPYAGRTVARIWLRVAPGRAGSGHLDDVAIAPAPVRERPLDFVRTARGSHSTFSFSRGNTVPLVARPHGAVFGVPATNADEPNWPYAYHAHNRADGRPALQAFTISHIPSPWIGDRTVLQVMPSIHPVPAATATDRALPFEHAHETDRPHLYAVDLDAGSAGEIRAEMTATDHVVLMRFSGAVASVHLRAPLMELRYADTVAEQAFGLLRRDGDLVTGWVDDNDENHPRQYVAIRLTGAAPAPDGAPAGPELVVASAGGPVEVAIAISFISVAQARRTLDLQVGERGFEQILAEADAAWSERLDAVAIEGTEDQKVSFYSNLVRLLQYPNRADEPTPDGPAYATPFHAPARPDGDEETGRAVVPGVLTVNHGFWDTYRTAWPMLDLLDPAGAGVLLDGLVQHYRDLGWTSRWTAPGPVDCMTGTSTDIVFADAVARGVPGLDAQEAYDTALRNASAPADDERVGRKGIQNSTFRGFTEAVVPGHGGTEGMSWTLDAAINDFAVAELARHLLAERPEDERAREWAASAAYFGARARQYANVWDEETLFFRGRHGDGSWRQPAAEFDPAEWGHDYTETHAWGTRFTVPHDGAGLMTLHGGPEALVRHLDQLLALGEYATKYGNYPLVIHEMTEARETRMGLLGMSNQPAHHIPFFYSYAGAHHRTQDLVREIAERLFVGSEIGQGYPGDEDNGEMSAWWMFAAMGLYPLSVGRPEFLLVSPLLERIALRTTAGAEILIEAPGASRENRYIQSVELDGQPWEDVVVPHARLADGAHLRFVLGPEPSAWGAGRVPASLSAPGERPRTWRDLLEGAADSARSSVGLAAFAVDDDSTTGAIDLAAGDWVEVDLPGGHAVALTVTARDAGEAAWVLEYAVGEDDWTTLDERAETFRWPLQTRPFLLGPDGAEEHDELEQAAGIDLAPGHLRLRATAPFALAQLELLTDD